MKHRFPAAVLAVAVAGFGLPIASADLVLGSEVRTGEPVTAATIASAVVEVDSSEQLITQREALLHEATARGAFIDGARVRGAVIQDPVSEGESIYLTWTEPMRPLGIAHARIDGTAQAGDVFSVLFETPAGTEPGPVCGIIEIPAAQADDEYHRLWQCAERKVEGEKIGVTASANLEAAGDGNTSVRADEYVLQSVPAPGTRESVSTDDRWLTPSLSDSHELTGSLDGCEQHRPGTMQLNLEFPHTPSFRDLFMTVPNGWCGNTAVQRAGTPRDPAGWRAEHAAPVRGLSPSWNGIGAVYDIADEAPGDLSWHDGTAVSLTHCKLPNEFACATPIQARTILADLG